jgi:hypothetical protein
MDFFFVQDHRRNYRFFSSDPVQEIQVEFSRWKRLWTTARQKLMLLPPRILRQEQAFEKIPRADSEAIGIHHSAAVSAKKIRRRFFFYLHKQRTKHLLLLIVETLLLPVSGLMALLPGPNVFFGFLALLMITHWQAFRGINRLRRRTTSFIPSPLISEWEEAVENGDSSRFSALLTKIQDFYRISAPAKILYK